MTNTYFLVTERAEGKEPRPLAAYVEEREAKAVARTVEGGVVNLVDVWHEPVLRD